MINVDSRAVTEYNHVNPVCKFALCNQAGDHTAQHFSGLQSGQQSLQFFARTETTVVEHSGA